MVKNKEKDNILRRLDRAEGQLRGIRKMIEEDRYCMDVLTQTRAVRAAVKKVEMKVLEAHLNTCVRDSFTSGSPEERREKIEEILAVFEKYSGGTVEE